MSGALDGVRVLDMGTMLAGPYGATLLGDLGADVIKVESPLGDDSRFLGPTCKGERTPFLSINRNKRGVVLDLRLQTAHPIFAKLAATSDVFITNIREPALSKLGLSYEQVRVHRPDIIWVCVTAFGSDGPYARRPGIDFLAQGFAGLLAMNGERDGDPVRVTVPMVDVLSSSLVANGVLAALIERGRSGKGQRIDVCLLDALMHAQCSGVGSYLLGGEVPPRTANRSQYFAPSGVYKASDGGSVCITCPSQKFFVYPCEALEVSWHEEERFSTIDLRLDNEDALDEKLNERIAQIARDDVLERLWAKDVLCAPVKPMDEVVQDPQVRHNEMIVPVKHTKCGDIEVTGVPIKMRGTPGSVRRAPPLKGEHTRDLLLELGFSDDEIEELHTNKSVRSPKEPTA